jgi:hypothetical protein
MNEGTPAVSPSPPPAPAGADRKLPFMKQVALGFLLPTLATGVVFLGISLSGSIFGRWSALGVFLSGVLGVLVLVGGLRFAVRRLGKGVFLGLLLFAGLAVLMIGGCFAMMGRLFGGGR